MKNINKDAVKAFILILFTIAYICGFLDYPKDMPTIEALNRIHFTIVIFALYVIMKDL